MSLTSPTAIVVALLMIIPCEGIKICCAQCKDFELERDAKEVDEALASTNQVAGRFWRGLPRFEFERLEVNLYDVCYRPSSALIDRHLSLPGNPLSGSDTDQERYLGVVHMQEPIGATTLFKSAVYRETLTISARRHNEKGCLYEFLWSSVLIVALLGWGNPKLSGMWNSGKHISSHAFALLLTVSSLTNVMAVPPDSLYPYGMGTNDSTVGPTLDGNKALTLSQSFVFFNASYDVIYVNNNGDVSFGTPFLDYTPDPFPISVPIIAPFWADADTRCEGSGNVYFRETTSNAIRVKAAGDIQSSLFLENAFYPSSVVIVTWDQIGYYSCHSKTDNKTNTFQLVLATDSSRSFALFLYLDDGIQWTTGDVGGVNGLGGNEAQVGYDAGDGINYYTVPSSMTPSIIDIETTSNVGVPGMYIFEVGSAYTEQVQVPPSIVLDPQSTEVATGGNVTFSCTAFGIPPPEILWLKDGNEVEINGLFTNPNKKIVSMTIETVNNPSLVVGILSIEQVDLTDAGTYSCLATNNISQTLSNSSFGALLSVLIPPILIDGFNSTIKNITDPLMLTCMFYGDPVPIVEWYFQSEQQSEPVEINAGNGTDISFVFDEGGLGSGVSEGSSLGEELMENPTIKSTLLIAHVGVEDAGIYLCNSTNGVPNLIGAISSHNSTVQVQASPQVIAAQANVIVLISNDITLQFSIEDASPPVLPQDIQWTFNGTELQEDGEHVVFSADRLAVTITNLSLNDEGLYTLTASNPAGGDAATIMLDIQVPPVIIDGPDEMKKVSGENVTFTCTVQAEPVHSLQWLFNGEVIQPNTTHILTTEGETKGSLTIVNISLADAGNYSCLADNVHGNSSASATLLVQVLPMILQDLPSVLQRGLAGDSYSISCVAHGYPPPTFSWFHNQVELQTAMISLTVNYSKDIPIANSTLYFAKLDLINEGAYYCNSSNSLAIISWDYSSTGYLGIDYPVNVSVIPEVLVATLNEEAVFTCVGFGIPLPSLFWSQIDSDSPLTPTKFQEISYNMINEVGHTFAVLELRILDANFSDEGSYQCEGSNNVVNLIDAQNMAIGTLLIKVPPTVSLTGPSVLTVFIGSNIILTFSVTAVPPVTLDNIEWTFQGSTDEETIILQTERYIFTDDKLSLRIYDIHEEDEGQFTLTAANELGQDEAHIRLIVDEIPKIINVFSDQAVISPATVSFPCEVTGQPTPNVTWKFDGVTVNSGLKYSIDSSHTLTISNVSFENDAGMYTCNATNIHGFFSKEVELEVQDPPDFTLHPQDTVLPANSLFTFLCSATGYPPPNLAWFKSNSEIISGVVDVQVWPSGPLETSSNLTLYGVSDNDTANYHCLASNTLVNYLTQTSENGFLTVQYPPNLLSGFSDTNKNLTDTLKLNCTFEGIPTPQIKWYIRESSNLEEQELSNSGKVTISYDLDETGNPFSELQVSDLSRNDEGNYTCVGINNIENLIGAVESNQGFVTVYVPPSISPIENEYILVGVKDGNYSITFHIEDAFPPVQLSNIHWHFTDLNHIATEIEPSDHYIFSSDFLVLEIHNVQVSDRGNYSLTAGNEAGIRSATVQMDVYVNPALINSQGTDISSIQGDQVMFNCTADGHPLPTIVWRRNGQLVLINPSVTKFELLESSPSPGFRVEEITNVMQVTSILTVNKVSSTDEGTYSCRADNEGGVGAVMEVPYQLFVVEPTQPDPCQDNPCENGGTCVRENNGFICTCTDDYTGEKCEQDVVIIIAPTITSPPSTTSAYLYSEVELTCGATGNPQPVIRWFKDEKRIFMFDADPPTLVIEEMGLDDRGFYHCEATNIAGKDVSLKIVLNINDIVQYNATLQLPESFLNDIQTGGDMQNVEELISEINEQLSGVELKGAQIFSIEINTAATPSAISHVPVLITLITEEEVSEELLMEVENELTMIDEDLNVIIQIESVNRFDGCQDEKTFIESEMNDPRLLIMLDWPEINLGVTVNVPCPCGENISTGSLQATRYCAGNFQDGAYWEDPNDSPCDFSDLARELCLLNDADTEEKVEVLEEVTADTENLGAVEVTVSVGVLVTTNDDVAGNETLTEDFLDIVDNILNVDQEILQESQETANTSAILRESIEEVTESIPIPENETQVVVTRETFAVAVQEVEPDRFQGLTFSADVSNGFDNANTQLDMNSLSFSETDEAIASLSLPSTLFDNLNASRNNTRITQSVFLTDSLFLRRETNFSEVGGIILAASVVGNRVTGLDPPIQLNFVKNPNINGRDPKCTFWNPQLDDGYGSWSSEGCTISDGYEENDTEILCLCTHLTSFTILLDVSPTIDETPPSDTPLQKALEAISYIGVIISIICLIVTVICYLANKKLRSTKHGQLLLNLCFALLGLYLTFIMAIHSPPIPGLCAAVGALLHYFFLVTFLVMAAEAVNLYIELVVVLGSKIDYYVIKASLICWVTPVLVVVFCFVPNHENYISDHFCRAFGVPFYIGMIAPFGAIYLFNWVVFVIIIFSLLKKNATSRKMDKSEKRHDMKLWKQQLMLAITLSIMFGLGWGIGLLATQALYSTPVRDAFSILFIFLTAFQGLFIFIMRCARSTQITRQWKRLCLCGKMKESQDITTSVHHKGGHSKASAAEATHSTSLSSKATAFGKYVATTETSEGLSLEMANFNQDRNRTLKMNVSKSEMFSETPTMKHAPMSISDLVAQKEQAIDFIDIDEFEEEQTTTTIKLPTHVMGNMFENSDKLSLGAETGPELENTYFNLPALTYSPSVPSLHSISSETDAHITVFGNPLYEEGDEESNL